jgi:hypothetical protein
MEKPKKKPKPPSDPITAAFEAVGKLTGKPDPEPPAKKAKSARSPAGKK